MTRSPGVRHMSKEELRKKLRSKGGLKWLLSKMSRYSAKLKGSPAYWYCDLIIIFLLSQLKTQRGNLNALLKQEGPPTFFATKSAAETYWYVAVNKLLHTARISNGY